MNKKWLKSIWFILPCFLVVKTLVKPESHWKAQNIPTGLRYDDVYFVNDATGWAAGGPSGEIYKTVNGGDSWSLQFKSKKYLRSVEFLNDTLGFSGSLDSSLYRTNDGGITWIDISHKISPRPVGICGLATPDQKTIYGCGVFTGPAFIIKSVDAGATWKYIDMSQYATALVDIHFFNATTGFAVGKSNPEANGGIILHTSDGGKTWKQFYQTNVAGDFVWKIQALSPRMLYASIAGLPGSDNVRMALSNDGGQKWRTLLVDDTYEYTQAIGFLNAQQGWIGGTSSLFETKDGGQSWHRHCIGNAYNRFVKINDSTAFISGNKIYKYSTQQNEVKSTTHFQPVHKVSSIHHKKDGIASVLLSIKQQTHVLVDIYNKSGVLLKKYKQYNVKAGEYRFEVPLKVEDPASCVVLRTNEGLLYHTLK
ncbi:hypothetical protein GCM10027299_28150 [Larkinella ripae]